jgi:hypothetical protein
VFGLARFARRDGMAHRATPPILAKLCYTSLKRSSQAMIL